MPDSFLLTIGTLAAVIALLMLGLKRLHQPYLIAYTLAGFLLGPNVGRVITQRTQIEAIGEAGLLLHMFFLGMELRWPSAVSQLRKPLAFQLLKTGACLVASLALSYFTSLPRTTTLVIGLCLMLNCTSVASEYLKRSNQYKTALGTLILSVLILQDLAFAPLVSILRFLDRQKVSLMALILRLLAVGGLSWLIHRVSQLPELRIPKESLIRNDHDLQLFWGLTLCFGLSVLTGRAGLSTSLGAFAAGIIMGKMKAFDWIEQAIHPFATFFTAVFYVYLGLLFDWHFFSGHLLLTLELTGFLVVIQSGMAFLLFHLLGYNWRNSLYAGALLSNIGEMSIVIGLLAFKMQLIEETIFKLIVAVSIVSILGTTIWTTFVRAFIFWEPSRLRMLVRSWGHLIYSKHLSRDRRDWR